MLFKQARKKDILTSSKAKIGQRDNVYIDYLTKGALRSY